MISLIVLNIRIYLTILTSHTSCRKNFFCEKNEKKESNGRNREEEKNNILI